MVTLSGWGEKKIDKKLLNWIVHSLSENNNKGRTDNSTSTKKKAPKRLFLSWKIWKT